MSYFRREMFSRAICLEWSRASELSASDDRYRCRLHGIYYCREPSPPLGTLSQNRLISHPFFFFKEIAPCPVDGPHWKGPFCPFAPASRERDDGVTAVTRKLCCVAPAQFTTPAPPILWLLRQSGENTPTKKKKNSPSLINEDQRMGAS